MEQQESEPVKQIKVVFAGASGVGKTSLLLRYTEGGFSDCGTTSTIGVDFGIKKVRVDNGKFVKCLIWDTAGQERFRATVKPQFRKSHVVFYVFDPHDRDTLDHVIQHYVNNQDITDVLVPGAFRAFVATKTDIPVPDDVQRDISEILSKYKMSLFWTSAKDNTDVDTIFESACRHCLHNDEISELYEEETLNIHDEINEKIASSCC